MAGYNGYSMSNNAVTAYDNGEKPISKWTKADIIANIDDSTARDLAKMLPLATLKSLFLKKSSWHHTSAKYNKTNFYSFTERNLETLTPEFVASVKATAKADKPAEKVENALITAEVSYTVWSGTRNHPKAKTVFETVKFRELDKMVRTANGNKRLSSLTIIRKI